MDIANDNPPLEPFTQRVLRGFEHLAVPYVLEKTPAKARRQRRPTKAKASDAPYPDQLSLPPWDL